LGWCIPIKSCLHLMLSSHLNLVWCTPIQAHLLLLHPLLTGYFPEKIHWSQHICLGVRPG
jgi:hypothetical protein